MYPIRFEPIYQAYIWGGNRIISKYHRAPSSGLQAESWEISDREEGMSVALNGEFKGQTLHQIVEQMGEKLLGKGKHSDRFPLLLKIIDAKEHLSIQVHPNEAKAKALKGEPKTEMWVALEPSQVYVGLKKGISETDLQEAIEKKKAEECLEEIPLQPGEAVFIPGGRVHAIHAGSLLYEIQQNSNTTYRLYDWGRVDSQGKSRPLHLKEAMQAIDWEDQKGAKAAPRHLESGFHHRLYCLVDCPFFIVCRAEVYDQWHVPLTENSFHLFFFSEGEGKIGVEGHFEPFTAGNTFLVPAAAHSIEIEGRCQLLWIRQP